jgi:hypothetical protein
LFPNFTLLPRSLWKKTNGRHQEPEQGSPRRPYNFTAYDYYGGTEWFYDSLPAQKLVEQAVKRQLELLW